MKAVVDASVVVKWLFNEEGTEQSRKLLTHRIVLHAPDLLLIEVANVIWKKSRQEEVADAQPYLEELVRLPDAVHLLRSTNIIAHASEIALRMDHPVYDCLYLACAEVEKAPLFTADRRLSKVAQSYPGAEVWHIADAETSRRIDAAAGIPVNQEIKVPGTDGRL